MAFAEVGARVTTVPGASTSPSSSGVLRGVVVTTIRGRVPSRSANCSWSQASSPFVHLPSSSHQAASNCGPRSASGSRAEKICAVAPFGQTSRLRVACHSGRRSGGEQARMPLEPKTITSRA